MKRNAWLALFLAGTVVWTGCADSSTTSDTSKDTTTEEQGDSTTASDESTDSSSDAAASSTETSGAPEALSALVEAAGDDTAAQDAWKVLFENVAQAYSMQFTVETDGEDYLYDENEAGTMVEDNFIYEIGKDTVFWKGTDSTVNVQLTDVNDSYEGLLMGYGTIDRIGSSPVQTYVTLNDTSNDTLKGTVKTISTDSETEQDAAVNALIDAAVDFGYVRTVNPISNSSLYTYDLSQKGSDWVLKLAIKDLDAFKKEAAVGGVLINDRTERPTLVLDEIESETWTFTFDKDGILKEEENDIYHVINGITDTYTNKYMNLLNRADFKKAAADDIRPDAFTSYFDGCADGSIKEGDAFTIENWD